MEKCGGTTQIHTKKCKNMQIRRKIADQFLTWKESENRKPILLQGARQIGKTWVMEQFGKEHYDYCVTFDFDKHPEYKDVFANTKDPERILKELSVYSRVPLLPEKTLIIFDEIQECEEALNSLKYFYEDAQQYHIMAAGSLLGVAVKKRRMSVPVGKVKMMRMQPISFYEFLQTSDAVTFEYIDGLKETSHLPVMVLNKLLLEYKRYQVCGGMPEAVVAMLENKGMATVEEVLQGILDLYEMDFAKYAEPVEIPRIRSVWHSLPAQLSKENRKFIYKVIRTGARSKDYEDALLWLSDAGMITQVFNISKPGVPLSAYAEHDAFKVYACDCGLLRRMARVTPEIIMNGNAGFTEFKGAMAENVVLQSLLAQTDADVPYYWTSGNTAEVEFVIQHGSEIIPIEVKAEENVGGKSLTVYDNKYQPKIRVRFSSNNLQKNGNLLSIPSPMACWLEKFINAF